MVEVRRLYKSKKSAMMLISTLLMIALSTVVSAQTPEEAGALFGLGMAACALGLIIWFVVFILIAIWVYRDAEKRGSSGALWLVIVILLGLIGIIIWLVVRPPIGGAPAQQVQQQPVSDRRCPNCGRAIPMDARICPYCNKNFEQG